MKIILSKLFIKKFKKLTDNEKDRFRERRDMFLINPFNEVLNNHSLKGKYKGYRSINITGDMRVIYEPISKGTAYFVYINTHSNLYG